ncbi:hypothetical protein NP233_g9843 [Leucocoprinus birnbaumii]|uniref:Uncharacterized protein n=1 Tax=Leucocoprinus birnbaumii TaxID=56174 RepID=A0AAD5VJG6_9AGAR|nr:hypothetical protein NP233_g9843 [Leucocoprinus birnbaumii]
MTTDRDYPAESLEGKEGTEIWLRRQVQGCCLFERLEGTSIKQCWELVRRVVGCLNRHFHENGSNGQYGIAQVKRDAENWRVRWIQREIDEVNIKLNKTEVGKRLRAKLQSASRNQRRYLEPLLAEIDQEDLSDEKRARLEEKMEEEYAVSYCEFRELYEKVQGSGITIGPCLREFYRVPEVKAPKPQKSIFRTLESVMKKRTRG